MNGRLRLAGAINHNGGSEGGDPRLTTLLGVLKALGIRLSAAPADTDRAA